MKACARDVGWSEGEIEGAQSAVSIGNEMKKHREQIEHDGVFGVPFAVFGKAKYWGHDRFALLVEDAKAKS